MSGAASRRLAMSMLSELRQRRSTFLQLGLDLAWLIAAVILAITFHGSAPAVSALPPALAFAILMVGLNAVFGLYRRDQWMPFGEYVLRQLAALMVGLPVAWAASQILPGRLVYEEAFLPAVLIALAGLLAVRQVMGSPTTHLRQRYRVLVLGTGPEAQAVESSLALLHSPGLDLAGFYPLEKVPSRSIAASHIVSNHLSLEDTVRHLGVDEIIVAVREQRGGVLPLRSLLDCRLAGIRVTDLPRFFERVHGRVPIESLKASWLIYGNGFRQTWWRSCVKRSFDVVAALILLAVSLPIMVLAACFVAFEGGAPIIYRQDRVGHHGRKFTLLKFRSMTKDAEKDGQPSWASINDSRVTPVGRLLRRSRIDELPQLINVLKGEMSLVGPRPERPPFVSMLAEQIPFYAVRHSVKPGLTGWAQVRYTYGSTVEESIRKLEYDLYYVKNHTLLLDVIILLKTVRVVLLGKGAR